MRRQSRGGGRQQGASGPGPARSSRIGRGRWAAGAVFALVAVIITAGQFPSASQAAGTLTITVVRTGAGEASVLGTGPGDVGIDVLVDGSVVASGNIIWIGEYWFLHVPVSDGSTVQTKTTLDSSPIVTVGPYVAQPVAPSGFIYAQGSRLMRDGSPIQLFGPDEATAFSWALLTWGYGRPQDAGKNQLFPSGPDTQIPGITTPDELWREYFRYFLHYNQTGDPSNPPSRLLRIWISDLNWGSLAYDVWESNPTLFYQIFDRMLYWAGRAGVYVCPILGQNANPHDNAYYDRSSAKYARHNAFARAIIQRYDDNPVVAMWDLWNEADVWNDVYWGSVGGIDGYRTWLTGLVSDVRSDSKNHLITVGSAEWTLMPLLPTEFGWRRHFLYNQIPGIDVAHEHSYFSVEDQYLIDWEADWGRALGTPFYRGEYGYTGGGNPLGYGYWPWFARQWNAEDVGPQSPMVFINNGKGAYSDYPYLGNLPNYPPEGPPPPPPPPPPPLPIPTDKWRGRYFDNADLTAQKVERNDNAINFDWGMGSPDPLVGPDSFSVRWEGYWNFIATDQYRFNMTTDDGMRVWVDNVTLLDQWKQQPPTTYLVDRNLTAGVHYIKVEFNELVFGAVAIVWWGPFGSPPPPPPPPPSDTVPPNRVTDLTVVTTGSNYAVASWSAPGDDGTTGRASRYEFRYSANGPLTDANFNQGTIVPTSPPGTPGTQESLNVTGLTPSTTYWFALRTADEVPNWATVSNSPQGATANPALPPPPPRPGPPLVQNALFVGSPATLEIAFSEPMDRASVEGAIRLEPAAAFRATWVDDARLHLEFLAPLLEGAQYVLTLATSAMDQQGERMTGEFTFQFRALAATSTGPLELVQWSVFGLPIVAASLAALAAALRNRRDFRAVKRSLRVLSLLLEELRITTPGIGSAVTA